MGEINRFVEINSLEECCNEKLREIAPGDARTVMGLEGEGPNTFELGGDIRNPTAVVMARISKLGKEKGKGKDGKGNDGKGKDGKGKGKDGKGKGKGKDFGKR